MKEFNNHTLYRARFQTLQHRLCASTMFVFVLNLLCFRPTSILCTFVRLSIELQNQTDGWETLFAKHVHLTQQARVRLYCEWMENQQHTRRLSITAFKNKYVDCSCSKCLVLFGFCCCCFSYLRRRLLATKSNRTSHFICTLNRRSKTGCSRWPCVWFRFITVMLLHAHNHVRCRCFATAWPRLITHKVHDHNS